MSSRPSTLSLSDLPIKRKMTVALMGTTLVALLVACTALAVYEQRTFRKVQTRNVEVLAEVLARNCTAAISFMNPEDARQTLDALSAKPSIEMACLYNAEGRLFTAYRRSGVAIDFPPKPGPDGAWEMPDHLAVVHPIIINNGSRVGTIYLRNDFMERDAHLQTYIVISALVLILTLIFAFIFSSVLQGVITRPIIDLTNTAKNIGLTRDYSARAQKHGQDEIGTLTDGFNLMLAGIKDRDTALLTANTALSAENQERKRAEELLAWEKSAMELICGDASLHKVLDGLMLSLEKYSAGALCSVLLLDKDGVHLRHGAAPSLPPAYNQLIDGIAIGPGVGSCGTAAFENRQVIVKDIGADPLWANFRDLALGYGLSACWSTPIHNRSGHPVGTFAVYYREPRSPIAAELDLIARAVHITYIAIERKQTEEEIRLFNTSLEQRVRERTTQLEVAVKELDAFSYSVSHDLRAPLRALDGFSRIVLRDYSSQLDEDGKRMLGVIRAESQRMGRLIDDLLAFSRLGRQQIERIPIDMGALAKEVFDELLAMERTRNVRLTLHELPAVNGSAPMIRQVWVNLIGNAIKFTNGREVGEVEIGTHTGDGGAVVFFVKDNGAGFDMQYAGKLFGVFQRLHSQQEFPGTGVGLALVQRIVQRHGGRIWAEAELDKGAAFFFTIPNPSL